MHGSRFSLKKFDLLDLQFKGQVRENQLPNKLIVTELNNEINTSKKENATLLERLEDVRKVVRIYYSVQCFTINFDIDVDTRKDCSLIYSR